MRKNRTAAATVGAALMCALAGCEAQKSSNPLSPSVAGPIPGVNISAPKLVDPVQGFKYKESQQPIAVSRTQPPTSSPSLFEVATDSGFTP
jgi:hypothetical protein